MSLLSELVGEGGAAVTPVPKDRPLRSEAEEKRRRDGLLLTDEEGVNEEELFSSDDDLCGEGERDQRQEDRRCAAEEGKTNGTKIDGRNDADAN